MLEIRWKNKLQDIKLVDKAALEIITDREGTYMDNFALMTLDSLLSGAMYKCDRARFTRDPLKQLDDIYDAINYLRFTAIRLRGGDRVV